MLTKLQKSLVTDQLRYVQNMTQIFCVGPFDVVGQDFVYDAYATIWPRIEFWARLWARFWARILTYSILAELNMLMYNFYYFVYNAYATIWPSSSWKITDRLFRYASPLPWNQLPDTFRQPRQSCLDSPPHLLVNPSFSSSPLSASVTIHSFTLWS